MPAPICPPSVKTAAILLIIVGVDVIVAGLAGGAVIVANVIAYRDPDGWPAAIALAGIPSLVGWWFIRTGVAILRARARRPGLVGSACLVAGILACVTSGIVCLFATALVVGLSTGGFRAEMLLVPAAALVPLLHSVMLVVAGTLISNNADCYLAWRRALHRPPEDVEYEQESE
jgi:hypothetical protein